MDKEAFLRKFSSGHKLHSLIAHSTLSHPTNYQHLITNNATIEHKHTDGLHMCNSLYLYTNPPPVGYGTPAPKTAETVLRAYEYNRKNDNKSRKIGPWEIEDTTYPDISTFPINEITGNYHPETTKLMAQKYLLKFSPHIIGSCKEAMDWFKMSKSDEMSKGRQTWDPESEKSITCAKAFSRTMELIEENLGIIPTSMVELLCSFISLCNLCTLKIKTRKVVYKYKIKYCTYNRIRIKTKKTRFVIRKKKLVGNEKVISYVLDYARSFCSYLKHKERGKKDRRAIASANIFLRTLLKIIEEFHLNLSKKVPGNTIGIGGDEKKAKIITELQAGETAGKGYMDCKIQGTEDATKWNECLNPSMFALVHNTFFSSKVRSELGLPELTEEEILFAKICDLLFFIMSIKRIHLGPGVTIIGKNFYCRRQWDEYKPEELNDKTRTWLGKVKISGKNYIEASPGFLMGMLNAASTTIGLLPSNFYEDDFSTVTTLRSSDDSMSVYAANTNEMLVKVLLGNYQNCKLIGINMSEKKTLLCAHRFGEYTSWYQDGDFVGQSGTETSSLRPGGINPQEDFNNLAVQTAILLRNYTINVFGAMQRLQIGIGNIRRLYNIKSKERPTISQKVLFLADGGLNPWDMENLVIDESTLRWAEIKTEQDKEYFFKVMSPDNPFSIPPEEQYVFSRDTGSVLRSSYEQPVNIFNYVRRSNRTVMNQTSNVEAEKEKNYKCAYNIATLTDPGLFLTSGLSHVKLSLHIESNMRMMAIKCGLNGDELIKLDKALKRLSEEQMVIPTEDYEEGDLDAIETVDVS